LRGYEPRSDRGKKARSVGRAPRTALKPSRRECRMIWLNLSRLPPAYFFAGGPWVAASTRHSLRPLFSEGPRMMHHSAAQRRENAEFRSIRRTRARSDNHCERSVYARCASFAGQESAEALKREGGSEAIQTFPAATVWIASSRSLSLGRASGGPVGASR
jgi:hypothetical protein